MPLAILSARFDASSGRFDDAELRTRQHENDIVDVKEHLVETDTGPVWALLVRYRPKSPGGARPNRKASEWRSQLAEGDVPLFEAMRSWRNQYAQDNGLPAYVVLTNLQAAAVATRRPANGSQLTEIDGIGDAKLASYGDEILALVAAAEQSVHGGHENVTPAAAVND